MNGPQAVAIPPMPRARAVGGVLNFGGSGARDRAFRDGVFLLEIPGELDVSPGDAFARQFYEGQAAAPYGRSSFGHFSSSGCLPGEDEGIYRYVHESGLERVCGSRELIDENDYEIYAGTDAPDGSDTSIAPGRPDERPTAKGVRR